MNKKFWLLLPLLASYMTNSFSFENTSLDSAKGAKKDVADMFGKLMSSCAQKKNYDQGATFIYLNVFMKSCAYSRKFPIGSVENKLCSVISSNNLNKMKSVCALSELQYKYSEDDLAPHFQKYANSHHDAYCLDTKTCFNRFLIDYSYSKAKELGCDSKEKLSYQLLCRAIKKDSFSPV